ncbi:MAG TPA: tRNA (adenosine(37)-N6)-dimethylallyltransferase MiaA, partial [Arthrobacter sp.]|nr:tRNA (adenosine(37)-N6)-dimethylallyltransferase MiaA [Arthrobacter sp.]
MAESPTPGTAAAAPPVIAVVGPTGSGKSDLAVALALALDGEVINADAMQFYRGMDIGTAKITEAERRGVPHHLLDILDVTEEASVSDFQLRARAAIADIHARGKRAILAGGSGLYVRAALDVLEFPGTDPAIRNRLEAEERADGLAPLRARLAQVDPVSAGRLGDARRVIRALEVFELTGRPFSAFMPERTYVQPAVQIGLDVDREQLRARLAARVHSMVDRGLLAEVQRL